MYYNKYDKYKNKYINILLNKLLLNEKLKLLYYLYQDKIIYTLYKYIYNDNIYNINTKVVKLSKFNILYKLLNIIIKDLKKVDSLYINIAYIIPLQNIKNKLK
jgi:hypothetical protein